MAGWAALDPTAVVLTSWWLAFAAIAVLQQAHVGLHEHNELPPLLHLVRDASLAVPSAAVAVIAASLLLGERLRRSIAVGSRWGLRLRPAALGRCWPRACSRS